MWWNVCAGASTLVLLMLMALILSLFGNCLLGAYFHGPQNSVQSVVKS
jgi:hypothetical protein